MNVHAWASIKTKERGVRFGQIHSRAKVAGRGVPATTGAPMDVGNTGNSSDLLHVHDLKT